MKQIMVRHFTNALAVTMSTVNLFTCAVFILFVDDGMDAMSNTLSEFLFYVQITSGFVFVALRAFELTFFKVIKSEISNSLGKCGCWQVETEDYEDH